MNIGHIATAMISTIVIPLKERGWIRAEPPSIRSMFPIFDPRMFPSASCPLPLRAATTQVASSGIDVPAAMTVIAMNLSETPNIWARAVAELTNNLPPKTSAPSPPAIISTETGILRVFISSPSSVSSPLSDLNEDQRYQANTARRMIPSNLLMTFSPTLNMLKFIPRSNSSIVTKKLTGISFLILFLVIVKGEIRAVIPKIINVLNILDPTMLPMAISALPCIADMKLTTISGDEVPIPTIVRPITNSLKPNFLAMLEEPSTR